MVKNFDMSKAVKDAVWDVTPWSDVEARNLQSTAQRVLSDHYGHSKPDPDNCGACASMMPSKAGAWDDPTDTRPNYAGWLRIYVEARRAVPEAWYLAEIAEAQRTNLAYYQAIQRSIKTFGIYISKGGK